VIAAKPVLGGFWGFTRIWGIWLKTPRGVPVGFRKSRIYVVLYTVGPKPQKKADFGRSFGFSAQKPPKWPKTPLFGPTVYKTRFWGFFGLRRNQAKRHSFVPTVYILGVFGGFDRKRRPKRAKNAVFGDFVPTVYILAAFESYKSV